MKITLEPEKDETFKTVTFEDVGQMALIGMRSLLGLPSTFKHTHTAIVNGVPQVNDLIGFLETLKETLRDMKNVG